MLEFYFRFRFLRLRHHQYLHTKFRQDISIHGRDIMPYYFRFLETNARHVGVLLLVPVFYVCSACACHSASACQSLSKLDHPRQSYDAMSIFQDGGHGIAILLPVSVFVTVFICEVRNLRAHQSSARYLNTRLRYYYFRFLKNKRPPC